MSSVQSNLAEQPLPQDLDLDGQPPAAETPTLAVVTSARVQNPPASLMRRLAVLTALGTLSAILYTLLFLYADQISALSAAARSGAKYHALIPIGIALIFSFVHGAFTGRFWDLLGLKARSH